MNEKRTKSPAGTSDAAEELCGYTELGMKREALKVARQILSKPRISPAEFVAAIHAIGCHPDYENMRSEIESAHLRQNRRFQKRVRAEMLAIYAVFGDATTASRFISVRDAHCSRELFLTMDVLLELERLGDAKAVAQKCERALTKTSDEWEQGCLIDALASYYARCGEWSRAFDLWLATPPGGVLVGNAANGLVELFIVCALDVIQWELGALAKLPSDPDMDLALPGNNDAIQRDVKNQLLKFKGLLAKAVPTERRKELGLRKSQHGVQKCQS